MKNAIIKHNARGFSVLIEVKPACVFYFFHFINMAIWISNGYT